jgi:hypothetical protein
LAAAFVVAFFLALAAGSDLVAGSEDSCALRVNGSAASDAANTAAIAIFNNDVLSNMGFLMS